MQCMTPIEMKYNAVLVYINCLIYWVPYCVRHINYYKIFNSTSCVNHSSIKISTLKIGNKIYKYIMYIYLVICINYIYFTFNYTLICFTLTVFKSDY